MPNTKKPKILYLITQGEYGGAQHYILDLMQNLHQNFSLQIAFGEKQKSEKFVNLLKKYHINYHIIPELKRTINWHNDYQAYKKIRQLLKKEKPDILHLNSSKISILGSLANIGLKSKIVYTAHGWVFNERLSLQKKWFYILAERFTAIFKQKIICVSEFDRQSALNYHIAPDKKFLTIHNGIPDFPLLSRDESRQEIGQRLDDFSIFLAPDLVVGTIGYLYKNKGFDYLINAIKLLVKQNISILLIIIGDGPEREELQDLIKQLKLDKNIYILGETKNASRLLRAFDIYICSSVKEGLSYTVIEAMTASLPIVATQVGGNAELIADKKEGLIIKPASSQKLADSIVYLQNNPELAQKYAQQAHKKALANFEIESMLQKTKYVYDSLLKK